VRPPAPLACTIAQLSDDSFTFIRAVTERDPALGQSISSPLINIRHLPAVAWSVTARKAIVRDQIDIVTAALEASNGAVALQILTGLHITGNEAGSLGDIGRLVDTVLRFTQGPDPTLSRQAVMSVLLSHPEPFQLLGIYVERELAIKMEEIESDPGIVEAAQQKRFWGSAFIYCLESKKVKHRFPRDSGLLTETPFLHGIVPILLTIVALSTLG